MAQIPFRINVNNLAEVRQALQRLLQNYEGFDESVQDVAGAMMTDSGTIDFTYDDTAGTITGIVIDDSISNTKLRNSGALSVIGRSANSTGDPADISASAASAAVLRESGSTLGFGTVATAGIADDAITDAKLRDSAALTVIGRSANSAGSPADIAAVAASAAVLRESGSTIGFGTVATAGIADDAVTDAKIRESAALTVIGRAANSTGNPADIAASAGSGAVLRESGNALGFGTIATAGIADDAVTYAKIQNVSATDRILGRDTSGAGDIEELTVSDGLEFTGTGIRRSALTGNVTASAGSNTTTLDRTALTDRTAETTVADGDLLLIDDVSEGALNKMTRANLLGSLAATFTNGIIFAHETLNYYDEGSFTPELYGTTGSAGSYATSVATGYYTRIGNRVFFNFFLVLTNKGSWTGDCRVRGLPFAPAYYGSSSPSYMDNITLSAGKFNIACYIPPDSTAYLILGELASAGVFLGLPMANIANNSTMIFCGLYNV